jgi:hypothetical protein
MSEEQSRKSRAWLWAVAVVGGPLLYLLSFPWVAAYIVTHPPANPLPKVYVMPYNWLFDNTPLRRPMQWYGSWCFHVVGLN